ncbi:Vesicle-associated membrane protein 4, partial [Armadillidium nasatum]
MANFSRKHLSAEDISHANDDEVEKLIDDSTSKVDDDDDFFLRGPSAKKTVRFATDKLKDVQIQIAEVTDVMRDNVGRLLERGDRLDELNERSEGLSATSDQFRASSTRMQRKFWWQNMRANMWIIVIVVVVTLLIIIPVIIK